MQMSEAEIGTIILHQAELKSDIVEIRTVEIAALVHRIEVLEADVQALKGARAKASWRTLPASDKQIGYAAVLLRRAKEPVNNSQLKAMTGGEISDLIDRLVKSGAGL